jgi:hypothetical protein
MSIVFHDDSHSYIHDSGFQYRSVTSVLDKLKPEKDWDEIKRKYAKKKKITVDEVTAMWDHEKNKSLIRGTAYHLQKELEFIDKGVVTRNHGGTTFKLQVIPSQLDSNNQKPSLGTLSLEDGIYPELIVWLDSVKLAGQADRVEIYNNVINVYDFKTNKKIDTAPYVKWDGSFDRLKVPCNHLGECNANIYYLQLNMYAYMIKKHNPLFEIGEMVIEHVSFNDEGEPGEIVKYKAPDMQGEVKQIMKMISKGQL